MAEQSKDVTVLVVGGGPAGSTAATLLARAGVDVLLLEKELFPRYHVGESLASSCRSVMELTGAADKIDSAGFLSKRGGLFRWGAEEDWTADWAELFGPEVRGWSVDRATFDQVLLEHAADEGVQVIQNARVKRVLFAEGRPSAVEWVHRDTPGELRTCRFDFLVDASGRAGLLTSQHFKCRTVHETFRNVAIWGYWDGGTTLPGTPEGGISVVSADDGWYWVIPVGGGRHSVGLVTHQDNFRARRQSYDCFADMLLAVVDESDTVRSLLDGATFLSKAHVEQDYSYVSETFCGAGYFIVGDAACFLDPLLSTGVHLATYSALLAAASIASLVNGEVGDEALCFYDSLYRNAYSRMFAMVSRFYQQYQGRESYFWAAQRLIGAAEGEPMSNIPFVKIISGIADLYDAEQGRTWKIAELDTPDPAGLRDATQLNAQNPGYASLSLVRLGRHDLYDASSDLCLVTNPRIGLRRVHQRITA